MTKLVKCLQIFQSLFYEVSAVLLYSTVSCCLQIRALWHWKSLFPVCTKMQMGSFYNVCAVYTSMLRNSLRSRSWGGGSGCSYRVERCQIIKVSVRPLFCTCKLFNLAVRSWLQYVTWAWSSSVEVQLWFLWECYLPEARFWVVYIAVNIHTKVELKTVVIVHGNTLCFLCWYFDMSMNGCQEGGGSIELKPCLTHTPAVAATLGPAASEWTVGTRAGCSVSNPILCLSFSPL